MSESWLVTGALGCIGAWTALILVRELVDAVERVRSDLAVPVIHGRGARVGDRRGEPVLLRRLEDVDSAGHVHLCPEHRVGLAERDLEGGQVDDVRDPVVGDRVRDRLRLGDVAPDKGHGRELLLARDQVQAPAVAPEVQRDDGRALAGEGGDRPGPEAAERPGDEPLFRCLRRQ